MTATEWLRIGAVGAGRMGRGIALAFANAGHSATLIDVKPRTPDEVAALGAACFKEIDRDLDLLVRLSILKAQDAANSRSRIFFVGRDDAPKAMRKCVMLFEGVPETLEAKKDCYAYLSSVAPEDCIIASTTSTMAPDLLAPLIAHPSRFLNAHWLNPAHLMPLVEMAASRLTAASVLERTIATLRGIGKVPIMGYVLARIQVLAMNEAARLVEEGVASVEDVDTAVRVGFGLRFSVLGPLEFADWGGVDILHHASAVMVAQLNDQRFAAPSIVAERMKQQRRGLQDEEGFYNYAGVDQISYRETRLKEFVELLRLRQLLPVLHASGADGSQDVG